MDIRSLSGSAGLPSSLLDGNLTADFGGTPGGAAFDALLSAQNDPATTGFSPTQDHAKARTQAEEFEAVFLNTMLSQMFAGVESSEPFGGGHAENTYRGLMIDEYAKSMVETGGIGIADAIERQLIELQEASGR